MCILYMVSAVTPPILSKKKVYFGLKFYVGVKLYCSTLRFYGHFFLLFKYLCMTLDTWASCYPKLLSYD